MAQGQYRHPLSQQCPCKSKRSGKQCKRLVVGGSPCPMHGGKAPRVNGSSDLSMGWRTSVWSPSVCSEHDPQSIMIKIFESVGQAADLFDDQVDGFGAAVGNP